MSDDSIGVKAGFKTDRLHVKPSLLGLAMTGIFQPDCPLSFPQKLAETCRDEWGFLRARSLGRITHLQIVRSKPLILRL
jgi:hypothetical protein